MLITEYLRQLIFDTIPDCREKLTYNVPYYKGNRQICFIWPGCITWGGRGHEGVRLGFLHGHLMADPHNWLERGNRKYVYTHDFLSIRDIRADIIRQYLLEATMLDGHAH